MEERRNVSRMWWGKCPLGRMKRIWDDNNEMDYREMKLAQENVQWQALVLVVLSLGVLLPQCSLTGN
jgi:hypothetical protein